MKSYREDDERMHLIGSPLRTDELPTVLELATLAQKFLPQKSAYSVSELNAATKAALDLLGNAKDALLHEAAHSREHWAKQEAAEADLRTLKQRYPFDMFEIVPWDIAAKKCFPSLSKRNADSKLAELFPHRPTTIEGCWLINAVNEIRRVEKEKMAQSAQLRASKVSANLRQNKRKARYDAHLDKTSRKRKKVKPLELPTMEVPTLRPIKINSPLVKIVT
jgi:hypothetical protein